MPSWLAWDGIQSEDLTSVLIDFIGGAENGDAIVGLEVRLSLTLAFLNDLARIVHYRIPTCLLGRVPPTPGATQPAPVT